MECQVAFLVLLVLLSSFSYAAKLQSSQVKTLMRVKYLLNSPHILSSWNHDTDFCNSEPTATLTVVCYEESISQLHIVGDMMSPKLPQNFSISAFFTSLASLPNLKVLRLVSVGLWGLLPRKIMHLSSLEILNLTSNFIQGNIPANISSLGYLQTLILEGNNFTGRLPDGLGSLSSLAVLNVKNNSLQGYLPHSLGSLVNLRILVLSDNNFVGAVPDLSSLTNLQVLDVENNSFGPRVPILGDKVERIVLRNNKFTFGIPEEVQSYYQLKLLDISCNRYVGPFPVSLISLPSITYINIAGNKFTGMLSENLPCNNGLAFVNLTSNLLTGVLPSCLLSDPKKTVLYGENCLVSGDKSQQPISFCKNEALAVGVFPHSSKRKQDSKAVVALSICAGVIGAVVLVCLTFLVVKNFLAKRAAQKSPPTFSTENPSTSYTSKIIKDGRYITQAMKMGALGLPAYRTFSLEELEEATNNFHTSTFMGEGSHGQMYRGRLRDGSHVAVRCLKLKRNHSVQYFMPHIELISKLRHQHLVSALGHCFEYYLDDSSVSRVFLIFEYVPNGTLRSWISERRVQRRFTWAQRIAAATGIAKGIQFLHTGLLPGLFSNNIKITDVLVDQNLVAKVSSYNLPLLSENMGEDPFQNFHVGSSKEFKSTRGKYKDKLDVYDFGVILLEVILGRPINSRNEAEALQEQLRVNMTADETIRKSLVDSAINKTCSSESVKTMIEICCRCLLKDAEERPSIEDVIWNLQFAAQVQDVWRGDSQSSEGSPLSPMPSSRLKLTIKH